MSTKCPCPVAAQLPTRHAYNFYARQYPLHIPNLLSSLYNSLVSAAIRQSLTAQRFVIMLSVFASRSSGAARPQLLRCFASADQTILEKAQEKIGEGKYMQQNHLARGAHCC